MKHIARSAVVGAAVVATLLAFGAFASAQGPTKCLAAKNNCVSQKMQGLLKCHSKAEAGGAAVDSTCTQKAKDKFDGGAVPAKGCFAKNEAKNLGPCVTTGDTTPIENKVDAFVLDVVQELDPGYPVVVLNKCSAGKKKCVFKKAAALLTCHRKAFGPLIDPACLQKAKDKFDGGLNPARGCFAKLELKPPCLTTGDTAALEAKVDAFVQDVLCELGYTTVTCGPPPTPTPTVTPTPTATPTCPPGPVFQGSLTSTVGRFNYNLTLGLPGANSACNSATPKCVGGTNAGVACTVASQCPGGSCPNFAGSHACTYFELQCAQAAGSLVGATDTSATLVTSFWAIDPSAPPLMQCIDDVASFQNWEYATAHTASRGQRVALNNPLGTLGPLQTGLQCNFSGSSSVGCCQ